MNDMIKQPQTQLDPTILENIALRGDLSGLNSQQKIDYYFAFCKSLGLNPLTKPFQIIRFQGKEILYASKDCTEQLRKINGVSITKIDKLFQNGLYIVTVYAQDKMGRQDGATGATNIDNLKGDALANSIMRAETKAKRRVTLSICGLGIIDESETDTIGSYQKIDIIDGNSIEVKQNESVTNQNDKMATKEQLQKIVDLSGKLNFLTKESIISNVNFILGKSLSNSSELTEEDAKKVIDALINSTTSE